MRFCVVSSEGSSEYYIVRVYRRQTGPGASKVVGLVEDRDGTRRPFRDFKEMVQVLAEAMEGGRFGGSEAMLHRVRIEGNRRIAPSTLISESV
jgi:hypothetical protein